MKHALLSLLLLSAFFIPKAFSQVKSDTIRKVDRTAIICKVEEISEKSVVFFRESTPAKKEIINKTDLWKIVYADGEEEVFNDPAPLAVVQETAKLDVIIKKDRSVVEGTVSKISDKNIEYRKGASTSGPLYELDKKLVSKIIYANGSEELFDDRKSVKKEKSTSDKKERPVKEARAPKPKKEKPAPVKIEAMDVQRNPTVTPEKSVTPPAADTDFKKLQFSVGPDAYYVIPGKGAVWTDEVNGMGLTYGVGGSARADFRPVKALGVALNVGYSQWTIEKEYISEGEMMYSSKEKLSSIPVSLGFKLYVAKSFYVMPEAGISISKIKTTTSETFPTPSLSLTDNNTPFIFGGGIGYEIYAGKVLIDVSAKYQIMKFDRSASTFNSTLKEPYHYAGLRIGIGMWAK